MFSSGATLSTSRLVLSVPVDADIDEIVAACQDPEIAQWTPLPSPYERRDAEWFVGFAAGELESNKGHHWIMRAGADFVGVISLVDRGNGCGEIGFWIAASARGSGYLVEAAAEVIDYGFAIDGMQLDRIEWNATVGNVVSARVARALGFHYEGTRRSLIASSRGRTDAWVAGLIYTDNRKRVSWPILS